MVLSLLQEIQANSRLNRDGRWPLYRYRVDATTLDRLAAELRKPMHVRELSSSECAAFVLYAACWFCRNYGGGPWAWHTVLEPLGIVERLPDTDHVVGTGLRWWGRGVAITSGRHEYLFTLAREGGLPLSVLRGRSGQHLATYLRRLLLLRESHARPAHEYAPSLVSLLPKSLQRDIVIDVTSELVDAVAAIRDAIPPECTDIAAWLAQSRPDWREELPVYLESDVAEALLRGLVSETPLTASDRSMDLRLVTELHAEPELALIRRLAFPKRMSRYALADAAGVTPEELPSRVIFHLLDESGKRTPSALATLQEETFLFQPIGKSYTLARDAFGETQLLLTGGGRDVGLVSLPGGEAEAEPLPWIFDRSDMAKHPRVRQRGSATGAAEEMLVALPASGGSLRQLSGEHAELGVEQAQGRRIVRLTGSATWTTAEDQYRLSTRSTEGEEYSLQGRLGTLCNGRTAWFGPPQVKMTDVAGHQREVPPQLVQWKSTAKGAAWRPFSSHSLVRCLGDVQLRAQNGAEATVFRARVLVLPEDFRVRTMPQSREAGRLEVLSDHVLEIASLDPAVDASSTSSRRGAILLDVSSERPLTQFRTRIRFTGGGEAAVWLPFPSAVRGFTDAHGELLPANAPIAVNKLRYYTAIASSNQRRDAFVLEAKLDAGWHMIAPLVREDRGHGAWNLPLSAVAHQLEAALANVRGIDSQAELRVVRSLGVPDRRAIAQGTARLSWHDLQPVVELQDRSVSIRFPEGALTELTDRQRQGLQFAVQHLHRPNEVGTTLVESERRVWTYTAPDGAKGPWLLTAWVFTELLTRPRLLRLGPDEDEAEFDDPFESALRVATGHERHERLKAAVANVITDLAHPTWARLDAFLDSLSRLPPATYDANYAIARNPAAAVTAAMRANRNRFNMVWDGLERLGVVWTATSVRHWVHGVRAYVKWENEHPEIVKTLGGRSAAMKQLLPGFFGGLPMQPRFFPVLLSAFWPSFSGLPPMENDYIGFGRTAQGRAQLRQFFLDDRTRYLSRRVGDDEGAPRGRFDVIFQSKQYALRSEELLAWMGINDCPHWEGPTVAPLVAAYVMAHNINPERELLRELRMFRAFDEDWFDVAHATALAHILGEILERDNDYIDKL